MKVYVFGNADLAFDNRAFSVRDWLNKKEMDLEFIEVDLNQDVPFSGEANVVIMDTVDGIDKPTIFQNEEIYEIRLPPRTSVHDFDLGFQLNYLKKLGKLGKITLIALPMTGEIDYNLIHSIFKKLVEQDIQGS